MKLLLSVVSELLRPKPKTPDPVAASTVASEDSPDPSGAGAQKLAKIMNVRADGAEFRYFTPNDIARWRAQTLFSKEPSTIEWLRRMDDQSVLLDVGANVGMYSIFAAATRGTSVFAFEPESQNFALLNKNIALNELQNRVKPFCVALSDKSGLDYLYLSNFAWDGGDSCHSLGEEVGFDLQPRKSPFVQGCASSTIDAAIEQGVLPIPHFIKIDVDGIEHKVINGAWKTLQDPTVKSICVEINTNLPEHNEIIRKLQGLGFVYNPHQVRSATRSEGAFGGCAEFILDRVSPERIQLRTAFEGLDLQDFRTPQTDRILDYIEQQIEKAELVDSPSPHVVIDNIFPDDFYKKLCQFFPGDDQLIPITDTGRTKGYRERQVLLFEPEYFEKLGAEQRRFWLEVEAMLNSRRFMIAVLEKFWPFCAGRISSLTRGDEDLKLLSDTLLVSDRTYYEIGPHTDHPERLVSFLFYLPEDEKYRDLGTSFYSPLEEGFTTPDGKHCEADKFELAKTVEFLPNRLLMFIRTDYSFHGVEQVLVNDVKRQLLINNIRIFE